jgi:hypothetical protein
VIPIKTYLPSGVTKDPRQLCIRHATPLAPPVAHERGAHEPRVGVRSVEEERAPGEARVVRDLRQQGGRVREGGAQVMDVILCLKRSGCRVEVGFVGRWGLVTWTVTSMHQPSHSGDAHRYGASSPQLRRKP